MLDTEVKTFANYSSIVPQVVPSDANMATVSNLETSYAEAVANDRYSKLTVDFNN
jgi:hypothetical protein